jgi:tetratricopeptide (TPR) repeat protein
VPSITSQQAFASAVQQYQSGQIAQAQEICRQILIRDPHNADALHLLGFVSHQLGNHALATELIEKAIAANPTAVHFLSNLAAILSAQGRYREAADACRRAIAIDPKFVPALVNLGNALRESGDTTEALAIFRQALAAKPDSAEAHANLGNALKDLNRFEEAIAAYQRASEINPLSAAIQNNLGAALRELNQVDEAIAAYRRALSLDPNNAGAHRNYSMNLLARGDFAAGWEEFDWRLRVPKLGLNRGFAQPMWDGGDLRGKTILLHVEGGFGDALHFVRYVPRVAQPGARVILECQPQVLPLLSQTPGVDQFVARGDPLPRFDCQIPLPSLPRIFQTTLENMPVAVPYLIAPAERSDFWRKRLKDDSGLKVGLVWAGSNVARDRRSRTPGIFQPLGQIPGVSFYSLQKGPAAQEPIPPGFTVKDFTAEIHDFADMAGLVANLDLVISVDTSTAHLAGAMAKPIWVLLPFCCEFRWLLERSDSPWYPTMRLFRQNKLGEKWEDVVERMAEPLAALRP